MKFGIFHQIPRAISTEMALKPQKPTRDFTKTMQNHRKFPKKPIFWEIQKPENTPPAGITSVSSLTGLSKKAKKDEIKNF